MRYMIMIAVLFAAPSFAGPICSSPYVDGRIELHEDADRLVMCDPDKEGRQCVAMDLVMDDGTNRIYAADQTAFDRHGNAWETRIEAIVTKLPDGTIKLNGTRYMDGEILGRAPELSCEA